MVSIAKRRLLFVTLLMIWTARSVSWESTRRSAELDESCSPCFPTSTTFITRRPMSFESWAASFAVAVEPASSVSMGQGRAKQESGKTYHPISRSSHHFLVFLHRKFHSDILHAHLSVLILGRFLLKSCVHSDPWVPFPQC